jgi:hypothetical protein
MPGPESLLERDPSVKERFLALIRDGVPRAQAALGCGFSYDTLYGWVRQGFVPDAREPYASFARDLYEAEVELMRALLVELKAADGKTDNRALEWLLERRFPRAFGRNLHEPADPVEDIERELAEAQKKTEQIEAGGDGGALDDERWRILREWFTAPSARLLELARETGLAQAAVGQTVEGDTKT